MFPLSSLQAGLNHLLIYFSRWPLNYYPFDMLQIKVFYLFILAAAPAATLPLPTDPFSSYTLSETHEQHLRRLHQDHPHQQDPFEAFLNHPGGTSQWVDVHWSPCITDIHNKDSVIKEKHIPVNTRRRVVHINLLRSREHMFTDWWSATDADDFSH